MEKQRTIEIVNELLGELKMKSSQLSKSLGIDRPQWIYDVLNPKKKVGLSKEKVELICNAYPQINKTYLLLGDGSLLRAERDIEPIIRPEIVTESPPGEKSIPYETLIKLVEENGKLVESNTIIAKANASLAEANNRLAEANKAFADANKSLADANSVLAKANNALAQANNKLTDANNLYANDIREMRGNKEKSKAHTTTGASNARVE